MGRLLGTAPGPTQGVRFFLQQSLLLPKPRCSPSFHTHDLPVTTGKDTRGHPAAADSTYWLCKRAVVFRKQSMSRNPAISVSPPPGTLGSKSPGGALELQDPQKSISPTEKGLKPKAGKEISKGSALRPTFANSEDGGHGLSLQVQVKNCKVRRSGQNG